MDVDSSSLETESVKHEKSADPRPTLKSGDSSCIQDETPKVWRYDNSWRGIGRVV